MSRKKILVVDDEPGFTRLMKIALPQYDIRDENDSQRAIATAREFGPDLILLDFIMPMVDGGDLAVQISEDAQLRDIPIIFITATVHDGVEGKSGQQFNGYSFLAKPITAAAVGKAIEEHLAGS
jgi:CheY-like chemotaxis protein